MKSITSHSLSGRSLGLLLSLILAASASAGPSAQQADQAQRQRDAGAVSAPVAASAAVPTMACPQCQTRVVGEFSATNSSGKWAPHSAVVGVEHDCASCRGAITTVHGRTTNTMTDDCPVCARAQPACCTARA